MASNMVSIDCRNGNCGDCAWSSCVCLHHRSQTKPRTPMGTLAGGVVEERGWPTDRYKQDAMGRIWGNGPVPFVQSQ